MILIPAPAPAHPAASDRTVRGGGGEAVSRRLFRVCAAVLLGSVLANASSPSANAATAKATKANRAMNVIRRAAQNAPLVGCWEKPGGDVVITFLPDGRAAFQDKRTYLAADAIRADLGTYTVDGDTVTITWLLNDPEKLAFGLENGGKTVAFQTKPFALKYWRIGGADEAAQTVAQVERDVRRLAQGAVAKLSVGPIKPGLVPAEAGIVSDRHPHEAFPGTPSVFRDQVHFQWVMAGSQHYRTYSPNEPGVTCFSYTFLPNGRFLFDGWLYGVDLSNGQFDERSPAEVRLHTVPVRHQQFWGKYRVVPGSDPVKGDVVEVVNDGGKRQTFHTLEGRLYMTTEKPRMLLNNWRLLSTYYRQKLQP